MHFIFLYVCFYITIYILWHYIAYNNCSYRVLCYRLSTYKKHSKEATEMLELPKTFLNMALQAQGMCTVHQKSKAWAICNWPWERHFRTNPRTNHNNKHLYFQTKNSAPKKVHLCLWCLNSNRHYTFSTAKITINWEIKMQAQCQQKSQIY